MQKDPIIGIDLGTTNSCAAVANEDGTVKLIPYKGGDYTVPSIFAVDDKGNELIGHEAKRQWQLNPRNTVYGAKRLMGRSYKSAVVDTMRKVVGYSVQPGDNLLLVSFGGGLTWGASIVRWGDVEKMRNERS